MHDHSHTTVSARSGGADRRRIAAALVLVLAYLVAEVVGALWSGSLALLADAGHMASDAAALGLALLASWFATRPSGPRFSFGLARAEVLAAAAQGAALLVAAVLISVEAFERLSAPTSVFGPGVVIVATGGLLVSLTGMAILGAGRSQNLNVRGAWLHLLSDALGSVGAIVAGLAVWQLGWMWADPAASLLISALVIHSAWLLLRDVVDVLMEAAPRGLDLEAIEAGLGKLPDVFGVHDLHVWTVGSGERRLSCHLVAREGSDPSAMLEAAYRLLGSRFGIDHATLQIEPAQFAGATPRSISAASCDDPGRAVGVRV